MLGRFLRNTIDLPWVVRHDQDIDVEPRSWAGQHVTTDTAQQLLVVYGSASFHADHLSTIPVDQYRMRPDGTRQPIPTVQWLESPFPGLDITDALSQMWWSYWMGGHAMALIQRNHLGRVTTMLPIHPKTWDIKPYKGLPLLLINGEPHGGEYLSIPHTLMPGQYRGINPIEAARQTIGMGMAAAEFGGSFFRQGTTMSGVVSMPGAAPSPDDLKIMRDSWQRTYGGANKANLPGLLFGGATWQQISITPEQAQFLETRRFTDAQICAQLFQLPPPVMAIPVEGGGTVQYQNIESAWAEVIRRWRPHLSKFRRGFTRLLPAQEYLRFNVGAYLEATAKERFETYALGITSGVLVPNEARDKEDMPPLPGGDVPRTKV